MRQGSPLTRLLKRLAAQLPHHWQTELKRIYFRKQIRTGNFVTDELEYKILHEFIMPGDWVLDIGANIGHYTKRFSELVGAQGRVIAFEPVPTTFYLLSANTQLFAHSNVTLINAAISDKSDLVQMSIPIFSTGLTNYYEAHISSATDNTLPVLTLAVDQLGISQRIALIKIDAEGHEAFVVSGMTKLIEKHHPILIIETGSPALITGVSSLGYEAERLQNSANILFRPTKLTA
ncbi:MAG: FkbM family methyltransferase [Methylococcales bacterium]